MWPGLALQLRVVRESERRRRHRPLADDKVTETWCAARLARLTLNTLVGPSRPRFGVAVEITDHHPLVVGSDRAGARCRQLRVRAEALMGQVHAGNAHRALSQANIDCDPPIAGKDGCELQPIAHEDGHFHVRVLDQLIPVVAGDVSPRRLRCQLRNDNDVGRVGFDAVAEYNVDLVLSSAPQRIRDPHVIRRAMIPVQNAEPSRRARCGRRGRTPARAIPRRVDVVLRRQPT
mmetsp:Transcript_36706/g.113150  ORF Transcript_36706/g.113150 Transcript_36706/m.113150 type:complete len:233 (-) Transcript_36706:220-918(-)